MSSGFAIDPEDEPATLVGLLDELLDQGVHVAGDLVLGLADVELVRVALRLLVASEDTVQRTATSPSAHGTSRHAASRTGQPRTEAPPSPSPPPARAPGAVRGEHRAPPTGPSATSPGRQSDEDHLTDGVAKLVLTVVAVIHDLVERQATRRVEAGTLTDDQVERLGVALQALEERMADVREAFGVTDEELDLDLGPLGRLR